MMLVAGFEPAPHELKARCSILFCYTSYATITPDGRFI
jgi:hypothetical protein